ncbi:flagellar motor switch protein FliM [Vibrio sp. CAU 1672]|uniref:FliM/FliN family flagellar motor switch protein n=1 Tax=Vibrio sp. CAU 1672 TaxID=3032594 RepID=UPI0023DBA396|nr:flagellar motor switch protein FliM [Vibrio sp. CAU 1672]MDF2152621.1 FliM/FliN family flagellar motor switch protein [Vibrio sp. CAU 1672]
MESRVEEPISSPSNVKLLDVELLGKPIHIIRDKLASLLSESCGSLTSELQNWLKINKVEAQLVSVELHTFSPSEMTKAETSAYRHQNGGLAFVHTDNALLIKLADRFYGASVDRTSETLTSSDQRLQDRISKHIVQWLAPENMWSGCDFEPAMGVGIHVELDIRLHDYHGKLHFKLDGHLIQTLIEQLELPSPTNLYQPFCRTLETTPVRLNVTLSKKQMALNDVIDLQPNDILPIDLLNTVPVSIGNQTLFSGRVAEQDGQLVLIFNHDKESHR